jgi:hypothetical protein
MRKCGVQLRIQVFWVVALGNKIVDTLHFEGMYWVHFQGPRTLILGDEGSTFLQNTGTQPYCLA